MAAARTAPAPLVYSKPDAAAALGISVRTLNRVIAAGDLNVQFIGHKRVIAATELESYVDSLPYGLPENAEAVS